MMGLDINLSLIWPEIFLAFSIIALLIYGAFSENPLPQIYKASNIVLIVAFVLLCFIPFDKQITCYKASVSDGFSVLAKMFMIVCTWYILNLSYYSLIRSSVNFYEYPLLMLSSLLGMMIIVSANDMLMVFMGLELQTLPLYVMVSMRRDEIRSSEAGLKYFILGALSSGIFLFGLSLLYGYTGSLEFNAIFKVLNSFEFGQNIPLGVSLSLVLICCGFAFKLSAVPFHMWTPDVYEGAPTGVVSFLSTVPKFAVFGLIARIMSGPLYPLISKWGYLFVFFALASMLWGSFAALFQKKVKRLLAYSSINNIGYAILALSLGTSVGLSGAIFYMVIYVLTMIALWGTLMFVSNQSGQFSTIDDLNGLFKKMPFAGATLVFLLFSLAGIPPLVGFLAKFYIFSAAVEKKMYWVVVLGVLSSAVAAGYYLLLIKKIIIDSPQEQNKSEKMSYSSFSAVWGKGLILSICFILVYLFVMPNTFLYLVDLSVLDLLK